MFTKLLTKAATLLIRAYQLLISPFILDRCRYYPSCSNYSLEAINKYGIAQGGYFSLKRILRCHPFGSWGYDPVPKKNEENTIHPKDNRGHLNEKQIKIETPSISLNKEG